ncbi:MAG: SH3 domain-containing protein [Woeseiaceae bacterium]
MKSLLVLGLFVFSFATLANDVVPVDKVKNWINIRQGPDASSDVVGRLKQGASLPLLKEHDGWFEVRMADGNSGYVSADWAEVVDTPTEAMPDVAAQVDAEDSATAVEIAETVEPETKVVADVPNEEEAVEAAVDIVVETETPEASEETSATQVEREETVEVDVVKEVPAAVEAGVLAGPMGPAGPPGPPGAASIKGSQDFLVKFKKETEGGNSQIYDNGNQIGIGTTEPKQRLEVNGSIQIHEQNSSVAGLMITQSSGETGYVMHNRASTLTIGAGSLDRITIDRLGNVGIGLSDPGHPLEMASRAHVTAGGVWTNSSSRDKKENIASLSAERAIAALSELEPVLFNYRNEQQEDYVGFIAEDVPDLVASRDRQTLSAMDIVAVLTKVVQAQQQKIEELEARLGDPRQKP